ncbi:hypothetical protein BZA70DRAFT_282055, partial [Myxozyma melibiosi]
RQPPRRILSTRPISAYSASSGGGQRTSDGLRKSAYSSRHSDGSGSISIRYSIAPRGSAAYRSFSGASDLLPGTVDPSDADDDELDDDGSSPYAIDSDVLHSPAADPVLTTRDGDVGEVDVAQRAYIGVPGFYFNAISSNYNSSEEEPDDDSTDSDSASALSFAATFPPPPPPVELDVVETGSVDDVRIYFMEGASLSSGDDDTHELDRQTIDFDLGSEDDARVIEIDENGQYVTRSLLVNDSVDEADSTQYTQYPYARSMLDGEDEGEVHIEDFDEDVTASHSVAFQQQLKEEDEARAAGLSHPVYPYLPAEYANKYVYRTREIESEDGGVRKPERALIPVYSEGLSMSTFPYTNSMAPLSAIVRQQPRGQFATAVCRSSVLLPPLPNAASPNLAITAEEERKPVTAPAAAMSKALEVPAVEKTVTSEDPLELLRQLEQARRFRHESMFESPTDYPAYIPRARRACSEQVARTLLVVCLCFPPMYFVMGFGGLDKIVGEIPRREKIVARVVGLGLFVGAIVGIVVGFVVGLR